MANQEMINSIGYGEHPTIYQSLADEELYCMYRRENWSRLDEESRQQLLQETVNRAALENGEIGSCKVVFSNELGSNVSGEQSGSVIYLNRTMFIDEKMVTYHNGREIEYKMKDANMQALTTVLHEDQHAWQNQIISNEITCEENQLAEDYKANDFDVSLINNKDEYIRMGSQYLRGEMEGEVGYYLYYLQATERDAFRFSEQKAQSIMKNLIEKYGDEVSFQAYREDLEINGYEAQLKNAQKFFKNENIEQDINQTLKNTYYGTSVEVDKRTEQIVFAEMEESYKSIYQDIKYENSMNHDFDADVLVTEIIQTADQYESMLLEGDTQMKNVNDSSETMNFEMNSDIDGGYGMNNGCGGLE